MESATQASLPFSALLLDTNVWLDYYLATRAGHQTACALIERACASDVELLYTVGGSKDLYYLVALYFKRAARAAATKDATGSGELSPEQGQAAARAAWACVDHLDEIATAVGCDQSDIWMARKQRKLHPDYEDDLVIAATLHARGACLVTSDAQLIAHAPVAALSPADALAYLECGTEV